MTNEEAKQWIELEAYGMYKNLEYSRKYNNEAATLNDSLILDGLLIVDPETGEPDMSYIDAFEINEECEIINRFKLW